MGRYFYDPVKDKEEKANRTWKYLTPADREKISLDDFTKQVNERQGGSYEPFEFKTILEKLQMGRTINENRSLSDGPVAGRSKPRYKRYPVAFSLHNQTRVPPNTPDNQALGYSYLIENIGVTWRESDYETVALTT